jgi:antitoxin YefM
MKQFFCAEDIQPLSEFRAHASGFIAQVHTTKRPLVITQNGKSKAVLLDAHEYDKMIEKLELFQDVEIGLDQIQKGKGINDAEAHQMLKSRYPK